MRKSHYILLFLLLITLSGCMKWEYGSTEEFSATSKGLFIVNEGNFQYGNASLSFYNPQTRAVENEVFKRANAFKLGDVAQSMTLHGGKGWVTVNNSHVLFAIDPVTFREVGRITNLPSPRYIHFLSEEKAYITQIWDNRILIVNPKRYEVIGEILCPGMLAESGSTEQMVQLGAYLYVNCWSHQNRLLKIDTRSDQVVDELVVGIQPTSLVLDKAGKLWTLTDGGLEHGPYGYETPALYRIDPIAFCIEQRFPFTLGDSPSELQLNGAGDRLYWINGDIWAMPIEAESLPLRPFLKARDTKYYGLTIDPISEEVYVADAIDFQQQGIVYRYSAEGVLTDEFYVGITPGSFCWK